MSLTSIPCAVAYNLNVINHTTYIVAVKALKWRPGGFYFVLALYAATLLLSTLAAADRRASAGKLVVEAYLMAIAILTFNVVRSDRALKLVTQAWMVGTVVTVVTVVAGLAGVVLFYYNVRSESNIFFVQLRHIVSRELSSRSRIVPQYEHVL